MAQFQIFSKDGKTVRHEGCPTYNGVYLKPSYIEFREICSPTPINWQVGDYVDYVSDYFCYRTGYRYRLYDIPQPTKKAAAGMSGEAFVYQSVQLFAPTKDLELCPFRDIVPNDNYIHYSTRQDVSTFENLEGIVGRIQKNLDDWYGTGKWSIRIASGLPTDLLNATKEARLFSVSGGSVLDAINKCYEVYDEIGWRFSMVGSMYVLTFGAANVAPNAGNTTKLLKYGYDGGTNEHGLVSISCSQSNKDEFGTRLYAFGSSRNMNFQYYRQDESILNAESLDIQHLMIPKEHWGQTAGKYDAHLAFLVNAEAEKLYGKRARYHYFDGSEDDEIFPSLEGMTIGQIRNSGIAEYYPSADIYQDDEERVDYPLNDVRLVDDGQLYDAGKRVVLPGSLTDTRMSWSGTVASGAALRKTIGEYNFTPTPGKWKLKLDANYMGSVFLPSAALSAYFYVERHYTKGGVGHEDTLIGFPCESFTTRSSFEFKIPNESFEIEIEDIAGSTDDRLVFGIQLMYTVQYTKPQTISATLTPGRNTLNFTIERDYSKTFFLNLKQIGFNITDRQAQGNTGIGTILFNSGMCGGRSFAIKSCVYVESTDSWYLECIRAYDESTGMVYPNRDYIITTDDRFVLLDIAMPDLYIKAAEQRLYARAQQLLAEISQIKKAYAPTLDAKMLAMYPTQMEEGMYMAIQDGEITEGEVVKGIIDNLTVAENDASIPTYRVTIRDEKSRSFKNSINSGASSTPLTSLSSSVKEATNYEDLAGKPKIGGKTITGNKSLDDYDIQQKLKAGDNITIEDGVISATGGGGGTTNYSALTNKPSIGGVTLDGNKTAQDLLTAGANITIEGNTISSTGGGGTSNYNNLTNKPAIDGVTLTSGSTSSALGLQKKLVDGQNISKINGQSLLSGKEITIKEGTTNYNALEYKPSINNVTLEGNATSEALGLQEKLVSGVNIAYINGQDILGKKAITIKAEAPEMLAAPRLKYADALGGPIIHVYHPLCNENARYEIVLMHYAKRNRARRSGDRHFTRKGWGQAGSMERQPLVFSSMRGAGQFGNHQEIGADRVRSFIIGHYCRLHSAASRAEMMRLTPELFKASFTLDDGFYGWPLSLPAKWVGKKRKRFGIALRWLNPDFMDMVDETRPLSDDTQMIMGVPKYLYTEVAPLTVVISNGILGFEL